MAIIKNGSFTTTATGTAQSLNLGFVPTRFQAWNLTNITAAPVVSGKHASFLWFPQMANATALVTSYTGTTGAPLQLLLASNGVTPFQTSDSGLWTVTTKAISISTTGISQAAAALVTTAAVHGFTSSDIGVTTVTFSGVEGMTQINTLRGVIQSVPSTTTFTVNINTTSFSAFTQAGNPYINVITGIPPYTTQGFQIFNTPQRNNGFIGLTLGSSLMVTADNSWVYEAVLDAPFTSA